MVHQWKQARCDVANRAIEIIASYGRRFLYRRDNPERVGRFEVDGRGRVWYVDAYRGDRIYTHYTGRWKRLTEGGTLHALLYRMSRFVAHGETVGASRFGPWPDWYCDGDLWGYGDDMESVRAALARECASMFDPDEIATKWLPAPPGADSEIHREVCDG